MAVITSPVWSLSDGLVVSHIQMFDGDEQMPRFGAIVLKAARDGFTQKDGASPQQAWDAVKDDPECPTVFLTFHKAEKVDAFIAQLEVLKANL